MSLSNYAENKILDHVLKNTSFTRPDTLYLALLTADPTDSGSGGTISEPTDSAYVRKECDSWDSAVSRATAISTSISFEDATEDWADPITHFAIMDTVTLETGNVIAYGTVTPNKTITNGDTPQVGSGELDVAVTVGGMSDYLANAVLDHVFEGTAYTQPTNIYIALCTATINDSDTGSTITEPGSNYARVNHDDWTIASAGASANSGAITFAGCTATWGTITHVALVDASSAGNMLLHSSLTASQALETGDVGKFVDGSLDITAD